MKKMHWMGVLVALALAGCERLNLRPDAVEEPLRMAGSIDGWAFDWNASDSPMTLGMDSTSSWCALSVPSTAGDVELEFILHAATGLSIEDALEFELNAGAWPLRPSAQVEGELDGLAPDAFVLFNGEPIVYNAEGLLFDLAESNVLQVYQSQSTCPATTTITWGPATPCQTEWVDEPFEIEYDDDVVLLTAPESGTWEWHVSGGTTEVNNGELQLPESNEAYEVMLQPLDATGPYGWVQITRVFPGGAATDCDFEFECEWEVEGGAFLEVLLTWPDGTVYSSVMPCTADPGSFEANAVVATEAEGQAVRLVEFQCDLALIHSGNVLEFEVQEGGIAFPLVP